MNEQGEDLGDDWIERSLVEAGREHRTEYIADDGFTASVASRLPAPLTVPSWRRPVVAMLWILGGVLVAISLPGLFDQLVRGVMTILIAHRVGFVDVVMAFMVLGAITWSTLVYAARSE
jgi:hypothetical protein